MTDKVQKIKEWISKEQEGLMDANDNFEYPEHEGAYHILCNLDAYIDSMQEEPEPQFKVGDTIRSKHWNTAVHKIISMDNKSYCLDNGGKVDLPAQQLWELVEEPVSEQNLSNVERIGKDWKEEPISEDFKKFEEQYLEKEKDEIISVYDRHAGLVDGAQWQKKQMMKDAIERVVKMDAGGYPYIDGTIELYDYSEDKPLAKAGDKVKIIIVKED